MIKAYTDGACRISNPGLCSCAWVLYKDEVERDFNGYYLGPKFHTNNYAEYMGLISFLEWAYSNNMRNVVIHCDSALVVNQVNQKWEMNSDELRPFMTKAYGMLVAGCHVLKHIKGHAGEIGNVRADEICNSILDSHMEEYYADSKNLLARIPA
jgi:ribonuclease HI